jgi:hypothetical protein
VTATEARRAGVNLRPMALVGKGDEPASGRGFEPPTCGSGGRRSGYDIIDEFANRGPIGDRSRGIARRILLSLADGEDPAAEDVGALIGAVLDSPLVKAARAVMDADPRFMRARLIELAAIVGQRQAALSTAKQSRKAYSSTPASEPGCQTTSSPSHLVSQHFIQKKST